MGKAAKSKREGGTAGTEEKAVAKADGDYEFKLPAFDEKTFIRREVYAARASFLTLAIAFVGGIVAVGIALSPLAWSWGWLAILGSMAIVRPLLQRMKFPDDVTSWKGLIGHYFMMFFTGLAVWILGVNLF